ncbi:MAG: twin-arginine translocase subunit TatC, partial [Desulfotomaculaceae bacterium]
MAKKSDEMSVIEHLDDLRRVLIVSIISTMVLAVAAYFFSDQILAALMEPLTKLGQKVFFTGITEAI